MCATKSHHLGAARRVIGAQFWCAAQSISSIKPIIKAAPTSIGSIKRKASVGYRNHQLWACYCRNFRVDVAGLNREIRPLRGQITNFAQKALVIAGIKRVCAVFDVILVNLAL